MLVNLPALFLSALSSCSRGSLPSLGSFCPSTAWAGWHLQLEVSPLGAWGLELAVRSRPLRLFSFFFLSTFPRSDPDDPACFHPSYLPFPALCLRFFPWAYGSPQGVGGSERPSVALGLSLVPRLHSEVNLTGAPFRTWAQCNCCRH